jgi:hypothetical protein
VAGTPTPARGIDGRLYFHEGAGDTRQIVFSVKGGEHLVPNFVRDLRGVIEREQAEIGVLISFEEPSAGMRAEAAEAGFYTSPWGKHPRIQILSVADLLEHGRRPLLPPLVSAPFQRAPKVVAPADQGTLFDQPR